MSTNDRVYVKPGPGLKYRDEYTRQHIPDSGAFVKRTVFVERRLRDGDIVVAEPPVEVVEERKGKRGERASESEG